MDCANQLKQADRRMTHAEFTSGYAVLVQMFACLSDVMQMQVRDLRDELVPAYKAWKKEEGPEPDWASYAEQINEMCRDDGMPLLFDVATVAQPSRGEELPA